MKPLAVQWHDFIILPTLNWLGPPLNSPAAVELLLGTVAAESEFSWIRQKPRFNKQGPALGFFQIEPRTMTDVLNRCSSKYPHMHERTILLSLMDGPLENSLIASLPFQAAVARLKYWLVPYPLPDVGDHFAQAEYYVRWYNGGGDATVQRYLQCHARLIAD